jgi:hypothetical protein
VNVKEGDRYRGDQARHESKDMGRYGRGGRKVWERKRQDPA